MWINRNFVELGIAKILIANCANGIIESSCYRFAMQMSVSWKLCICTGNTKNLLIDFNAVIYRDVGLVAMRASGELHKSGTA